MQLAGKDADQIVVGQNGEIFTAPETASLPANESTALNAVFRELGYASEDGVTLTDSRTLEDIRVWQSFYPVRRITTERLFTVAFVAVQWNQAVLETAFGAEVEHLGSGHYKLHAPAPEALDIRSVIVDWHDGDKDYRLVVPRAIIAETVEARIARNAAAQLPLTLSVLAEEGGEPWYILSNDPALAS